MMFFLKDIALEAIGLACFVITVGLSFAAVLIDDEVVSLRNKSKWEGLDMDTVEICFYVFQGLKYALLVFSIVSEHFYEELDDIITLKLARVGVRYLEQAIRKVPDHANSM